LSRGGSVIVTGGTNSLPRRGKPLVERSIPVFFFGIGAGSCLIPKPSTIPRLTAFYKAT
jgi:hypothetical protein